MTENGFLGFLDSENIWLDTKMIHLAHFLEKLQQIQCDGGHLGRHLELCEMYHDLRCPPNFFKLS